jgi:uncharacterized protein YkwD
VQRHFRLLVSAAVVMSFAGGSYLAVSHLGGTSVPALTAGGATSTHHVYLGNALMAVQPAARARSGAKTATPTPSASKSAPKPTSAPKKTTPVPKPKKTTPPPSKTSPPAGGSTVSTLLAQINGLRAKHKLAAYTLLSGLNASAHKHNLQMMGTCGMSHQCPGEASLGDRISAEGVHWSACGENIGYSGPHPDTSSAIIGAGEGLTTAMYNEKPPDDGHRLNLLSTQFHHIGIDVIRNSDGTVWLTQDFSS